MCFRRVCSIFIRSPVHYLFSFERRCAYLFLWSSSVCCGSTHSQLFWSGCFMGTFRVLFRFSPKLFNRLCLNSSLSCDSIREMWPICLLNSASRTINRKCNNTLDWYAFFGLYRSQINKKNKPSIFTSTETYTHNSLENVHMMLTDVLVHVCAHTAQYSFYHAALVGAFGESKTYVRSHTHTRALSQLLTWFWFIQSVTFRRWALPRALHTGDVESKFVHIPLDSIYCTFSRLITISFSTITLYTFLPFGVIFLSEFSGKMSISCV